MAIGLRLFDLDTYDLILVDDSITGAERCETIRAVTGVKRPIVVIHDDPSIFEVMPKFLAEARISAALIGMLHAIPTTPLYDRLKQAGRLHGMHTID